MNTDENLGSALQGEVCDTREGEVDRSAELKIWIMIPKGLFMTRGKAAAQSGHAAGTCMVLSDRADRAKVDLYMSQGQAKVSVGVDDEHELRQMVDLCRQAGLIATLVEDAGRTEFEGRTVTYGAVGPCLKSELPSKVKRLRILTD